MAKDILDSKRNPVNKTAARVLQPGEHYDSPVKVPDAALESDLPLPMQGIADMDRVQLSALLDIIGHRCGRLTIYGRSTTHAKRYVCRCDCGRYVLRSRKAMFNPKNPDACSLCRHLRHQRNADHFRRTGKDLEDRHL